MQKSIKWIADRIIGLFVAMLLLPFMLIFAVWVLIDDGRPVLFIQRRVGKNGREFPMLKFRSMVNNAVEVGMKMQISDDPHGIVKNDPRITRSGRFMRRTGADEFPQIFNVIAGQMSLVGPRPDIPDQVKNYSENDRRRLEVLPGITGYSQVHGRDEIEWPERIRQDIHYIDTWSLWSDIKICFQTVGQIFRGEPDPIHDSHNVARSQDTDK